MFADEEADELCIVTMKVTEKKRVVKPTMLKRHDTYMEERAKKKREKTADGRPDDKPSEDDPNQNAPSRRGRAGDMFA